MNKDFGNTFAGRWIHTVASNFRKIFILCFLVALVASTWALTRKQYWRSSAMTMVPGAQQSTMGLAGIGGIAGNLLSDQLGGMGAMLGAGTGSYLDLNLVIQILNSRTVKEKVIFEYDLLPAYSVPSMDHAIKKFNKKYSVSLNDEGFIIVSMEAESREQAAAMVNDAISFTNEELASVITSRARRSRLIAEEMLHAAEESLHIAQLNMEAFREETGVLFPEEQGIETITQYAQLETELITAESELAGLASTLSSSSTAYSEIAGRVEYLRNAMLNKASGDSLSYFPGLDSMPSLLMVYENLAIDLETRRVIYLMIRQELEALKLEEVRESPTLEIIVPAVPTALRSYPKRSVMVISYTFIAFLLSLLWMAVLTYTRQIMENQSTGPFLNSILSILKRQLFLKAGKSK